MDSCYGLVILNYSLILICYRDPRSEIDPLTDVIHIWTTKDYGVNDTWISRYTITPLPTQSLLTIWNHLLLLKPKVDN